MSSSSTLIFNFNFHFIFVPTKFEPVTCFLAWNPIKAASVDGILTNSQYLRHHHSLSCLDLTQLSRYRPAYMQTQSTG